MNKFLGKKDTELSGIKRYILFFLFFALAIGANAQYDINQFFFRGRQFLIDGKYANAIDNFNVLVRLDSTLFEAYYFRGIAKYNLGDFIGAEKDFDKSLKINPIYTPAYHYRAITLSRTGKYDLALKDLAEAVDLRPSYTGLYFSRGVTYFLSQQFEKAVSDFNRFIKAEPKIADAYLNRGACYLYLKDTVKALADYNRAVKLNMFDPEGYIRRSRVHSMQGNNELAMQDLNEAIALDTANTFAYFNRALIRYDMTDINGALEDLNRVLEYDPGNALTLYNRALIRSQIGDYNNAIDDYDRVIAVNPNNVLAYFNRAGVFLELGRFRDAMDDYSQAINLYPDFAKAYYNRSYVKNQLGQFTSAKKDYEIAEAKVREYRAMTSDSAGVAMFADTAKKYDRLLALDADFAKKDFDNELLQHRDVDIRLKPLYKINMAEKERGLIALERRYDDKEMESFMASIIMPVELVSSKEKRSFATGGIESRIEDAVDELSRGALSPQEKDLAIGRLMFAKAIIEGEQNKYNSALSHYDKAVQNEPDQTFYYINRGALQAEMIDFISSIESNVQVLTLDNAGATRARVQDKSYMSYDYTPAIHDMNKAASLMPSFPYVYYNLGNLYCLSGDLPESINQYTKALDLYPSLAEAYYNRGLVLIYLKDKAKGCIDLSKAGELGIDEAYPVIKKYCMEDQ
ncbi:MAG: tetratricopeptide repeat protein [Bacteroidales bacterium]|nr:tetratricopeptide repeat protein [Bacteroidales bacterium]